MILSYLYVHMRLGPHVIDLRAEQFLDQGLCL